MRRRQFPSVRLHQVNNILLAGIVLINAYIIVWPILPPLFFRGAQNGATSPRHLIQKLASPAPVSVQPNQLIIPVMQYDQQIIEGPTIRALHYGPWREPSSSTPDKGGNMVIAGHRFTYTNPRGTFYYLNKVQTGDEIGIIWNNKTYRYTVTMTEVVPPSDTSVTAPTTRPQLTLYTCTPLWLPKNRLVIIAKPEILP